jgi:5-methylcytosine-specific restriction endonuclease McrA
VEIVSCVIVALQELRCYNGIMNTNLVQSISDEQLLRDLKEAAAHERNATARLIALLAEMDVRRLYLAEGYSSLFMYCTRCLHLSEHASYGRIEAARAARKFPVVLQLLRDGSITLTAVCLLANHLTPENHRELLEAARHKSKREVEVQVAALRPVPDVRCRVRKLPEPTPSGPLSAEAERIAVPARVGDRAAAESKLEPQVHVATSVIRPLAPERFKVQLTISRETHDKLRRVQDLLRHVVPTGDVVVIFERALTLLLQNLERTKTAQVDRPRRSASLNVSGRYIPAAVRREVWARDGGQCAFVGANGQCTERGFLEFHHVIPFADGGPTTVENLQLRCRAHNAYEATEYFGPSMVRERSMDYQLGPDRVVVLAQERCRVPTRICPAPGPLLSAPPFSTVRLAAEGRGTQVLTRRCRRSPVFTTSASMS